MLVISERRRRQSQDRRNDLELYYYQRLRNAEKILSDWCGYTIILQAKAGWIELHGRHYRINQIEKFAAEKEAMLCEVEIDFTDAEY